jgi:hypothetical protein
MICDIRYDVIRYGYWNHIVWLCTISVTYWKCHQTVLLVSPTKSAIKQTINIKYIQHAARLCHCWCIFRNIWKPRDQNARFRSPGSNRIPMFCDRQNYISTQRSVGTSWREHFDCAQRSVDSPVCSKCQWRERQKMRVCCPPPPPALPIWAGKWRHSRGSSDIEDS